MRITKKQLRKVIEENIAMRNMIQKSIDTRVSTPNDFEETEPRRRRSDPITKSDIVKGSFKGTASDRADLTNKLRKKINKLIDQGYEKDIPSNWESILMVNNGDALIALSKIVFPGFFGTIARTLFPAREGKITKSRLKNLIKEIILEESKNNVISNTNQNRR